jgi:hypothetical protein
MDRKGELPRWQLDREATVVVLVSLLFTLPIWLGTQPPMADYPQHLSMASILRWYHDPARHLVENYAFVYTRPNTAFFFFVAALSYVMPLEIAGKLLMALSVLATGLAGLTLARRAGRPGWFGLFTLLATYDFAFFFGFVNNVIATPLFVYGIVLVDRLLDRPVGWRSWLTVATYTCCFYFVHVQFLFLFVCTLGWLTLTRFPGWRSSLAMLSTPLVGVTMTLLYYFLRHEETYGYHEKRIFTTVHDPPLVFDKVSEIPGFVFGIRVDGTQWLLFLLCALAALRLSQVRLRTQVEAPCASEPQSAPLRARVPAILSRTRFHSLGAWLFVSYLLMPHVFVGVFVYQRLIAVAWLIIPAVLPIPDRRRLKLAKLLVATALVVQLLLVADTAYTFDVETRGGHELIAKTEPGKSLMPIILNHGSTTMKDPPLALHFGAYYLAEKGGRISFSFSELHISSVQLRPGLAFDDLHTTAHEWTPQLFLFSDFGYHFDYFLYRGDFERLPSIFGKSLAQMNWETRDDWILLWRKPTAVTPIH